MKVIVSLDNRGLAAVSIRLKIFLDALRVPPLRPRTRTVSLATPLLSRDGRRCLHSRQYLLHRRLHSQVFFHQCIFPQHP